MGGTALGGAKSRDKLLKDNPNFYREIGAKGGSKSGDELDKPKGFAAMPVEKRAAAGAVGGKRSSRKGTPDGQGKSRSSVYKHTGSTVPQNAPKPATLQLSPKGLLLEKRPALGPLRIEKPKWYQWAYKRQLKRLGVR